MKRVIASVVAYHNDPQTLRRSIDSFLNSAGDTLLFLIDNSTNDQFRTLITDPRVIYQHVGTNIGFGPGHNLAMRKSLDQADYHLVLDPDVSFQAGVIPTLIRFMDGQKDIGLVMPKVHYPDGRSQHLCKLLPTPFTLITRRFLPFVGPLINAVNDQYELRDADDTQVLDVPFLSGCFMFFRNEALRQVGLFDERFFLYSEDIDISRRMHAQYRTVYYPGTEIVHVFGKAPYKNWKALWVNIQSAVTYFNKWGWWDDPQREEMNRTTLANIPRRTNPSTT